MSNMNIQKLFTAITITGKYKIQKNILFGKGDRTVQHWVIRENRPQFTYPQGGTIGDFIVEVNSVSKPVKLVSTNVCSWRKNYLTLSDIANELGV